MRSILAIALALAVNFSLGHSESENAADSPSPVGCERLPENALTSLPEPVADWAVLDCLPVGQVIAQRDGWTWRFPGSFFDRPWIFAAAPENSQHMPGLRYFTRLTVAVLDRDSAATRHAQFRARLPTYGMENPPVRMLRLEAVNDLSDASEVFVSFGDDQDGWVIVCSPVCAVEGVFMITRNQR